MDTKFATNVSNRMLLNAAKFQGYSFYRFWVIKGKPLGGKITPPLPRLGLNTLNFYIFFRNLLSAHLATYIKGVRVQKNKSTFQDFEGSTLDAWDEDDNDPLQVDLDEISKNEHFCCLSLTL